MLILFSQPRESGIRMDLVYVSLNSEIHGEVVSGMVHGVITLTNGLIKSEKIVNLMVPKMMVFSGWTSTISERSSDFGQ